MLTASGGPFLDATPDELAAVTPEQALRHPTWTMGAKITIDSATLANKGLEVIEAHWLYDVDYDAIDVVVHPQSVVHSAVLFIDGSLKAQLGTPDMRLPIQYALTHPERLPSPATPPDLVAAARLDFRAPDEARFPALRIAREAGRIGQPRLGRADRRRRGRRRPLPRRHARLPGHPAPARGRRAPLRRGRRPGARRRRARRARREVRAAFATGPVGGARMIGHLRQSVVTILLFIFVLGGLVLIHELGHFVTARWAKVRVLEFGIGFPPRAKVLGRGKPDPEDVARPRDAARAAAGHRAGVGRGAGVPRGRGRSSRPTAAGRCTRSTGCPIGGFVKLEDEDGDDADDPRSFGRARLPIKLVILVAGVAMNLLLAFVIFTGIALWGEPDDRRHVRRRSRPARRPRPRASSPGDTIVTHRRQAVLGFGTHGAGRRRRPAGARRRDRRPRRPARRRHDRGHHGHAPRSRPSRRSKGALGIRLARRPSRSARSSSTLAEAVQLGAPAHGRRRSA